VDAGNGHPTGGKGGKEPYCSGLHQSGLDLPSNGPQGSRPAPAHPEDPTGTIKPFAPQSATRGILTPAEAAFVLDLFPVAGPPPLGRQPHHGRQRLTVGGMPGSDAPERSPGPYPS